MKNRVLSRSLTLALHGPSTSNYLDWVNVNIIENNVK